MNWQMKSAENASWFIITTEMLALLLLSLTYQHHHLRNKLSLPMYREQRLKYQMLTSALLKPVHGLPDLALFLFLGSWLRQLSPGMHNVCGLF